MQERELRAMAAQMAERYGLDPVIFTRMIEIESSFNPNARNARTGATGLGQVMSATAQDPGFGVTPLRDRLDAVENLRFSAEYLSAMVRRYGGDYRKGLAAYNAGPGTVDRVGGIPEIPETQDYLAKVLGGPMRPRARPSDLGQSRAQQQQQEPPRMRPQARPETFGPMAEQRNQAIRQALLESVGARSGGIAGLMQ
jgi:soluble lytic murein transglycosylase-like protein